MSDKYILATKYAQVTTFTNYNGDKMFSIRFVVPEDSDDSYRGWKIKKARKVAKQLRKIAKTIERLDK